jgi:hypothetical protein
MQNFSTWWKEHKPAAYKLVGGRYHWFVLAGTVMISISPAIREYPRENARLFSEALENAPRYVTLRDDLATVHRDLRRDLRNLTAQLRQPKAPIMPADKIQAMNDGEIEPIVLVTEAAQATLNGSDPLIELTQIEKRGAQEEKNTELKVRSEQINRDLETAIEIAVKDKSEGKLFEQEKALIALLRRADNVYKESGDLKMEILGPLIYYRAYLQNRAHLLALFSYALFALGVCPRNPEMANILVAL